MVKPLIWIFQTFRTGFQLWFEQPSPGTNDLERHQILINPYTGLVTGQRLLIDFERSLARPVDGFYPAITLQPGVRINGDDYRRVIGLACCSVLTGLILWWPNPG